MDTGLLHVEGLEKSRNIEKKREKKQEHTRVKNPQKEVPGDVPQFEVADLMGQNGDKLIGCVILHKSVEQSDPFVFSEARKEGIRFGGAARPVHDMDVPKRKLHTGGILPDALSQLTVRKRLELVEKRHDPCRRDELDEQGEECDRQPGPRPCPRAPILKKSQDACEQWNSDQHREQKALQQIRGERFQVGAIEPEALLDHKGGPDPKG